MLQVVAVLSVDMSYWFVVSSIKFNSALAKRVVYHMKLHQD